MAFTCECTFRIEQNKRYNEENSKEDFSLKVILMGSLLTLLLLAEDGLELLDAVRRRQPSLARQAERWKNTKMHSKQKIPSPEKSWTLSKIKLSGSKKVLYTNFESEV